MDHGGNNRQAPFIPILNSPIKSKTEKLENYSGNNIISVTTHDSDSDDDKNMAPGPISIDENNKLRPRLILSPRSQRARQVPQIGGPMGKAIANPIGQAGNQMTSNQSNAVVQSPEQVQRVNGRAPFRQIVAAVVTDLPWDGTYLGEFKRAIIEWELKTRGSRYCQMTIRGITITCQVRTVRNCVPCIIDELKPLFGLERLQTHYLKFGKTIYLLMKSVLPVDLKGFYIGGIQEDYKLSELVKMEQASRLASYDMTDEEEDQTFREIYRPEFVAAVQKIYVFRNMLGISQNYDRSISVRVLPGDRVIPLSNKESKMEPVEYKALSQTLLKRWFRDSNARARRGADVTTRCNLKIKNILRGMLGITSEEDEDIKPQLFRQNIWDVIHRINPDYIHNVNFIMKNIEDKLDYSENI